MNKTLLFGIWKLVEYNTTVEGTNEVISLFDGNATGYLIYTPEGFMSVHLMNTKRPPSESKLQEQIETAENYGGYTGRYEVIGTTVVHYPEISSVLSYLQTPQKREFEIIGNQLHLIYSHSLDEYTLLSERPVKAHSKVVWEKMI